MGTNDTKSRILSVALDLFSQYGYEATSVGQIADAVGIKKPSLYAHFENKQDIFDTLINNISEYYENNSFTSSSIWENDRIDKSKYLNMSVEDAVKMVTSQLEFLIHDQTISKIRKLFTIEQYRNSDFANLMETRSLENILSFHKGLARFLMDNGKIIQGDEEIIALEFISPISMMLYKIDRLPSLESDGIAMVERHIRHFYDMYKI